MGFADLEKRIRKHEARSGEGRQAELVHCLRSLSRVLGDSATDALTSDGATQTLAAYGVDLAAGRVMIGGDVFVLAARTDDDLLADFDGAVDLNGDAAAAIADDNTDAYFMHVAIVANGAMEEHIVKGAEAGTGAAVAPTPSEIRTALVAAGIANHNDSPAGVILNEILVARGAGSLTGLTHTDPASDETLASYRSAGALSSY